MDAVTITAILCLIVLIPSFATYPYVLWYRDYGPLRALKSTLVLTEHFGACLLTVHIFLRFEHQNWCLLLSIVECCGSTLFFGTMVIKHHSIYSRYVVLKAAPKTWLMYILTLFPFSIISVYRAAVHNTNEDCPHVEYLMGIVGALYVFITLVYRTKNHVSMHFNVAFGLEVSMALACVAFMCVYHFAQSSRGFASAAIAVQAATALTVLFAPLGFPLLGHWKDSVNYESQHLRALQEDPLINGSVVSAGENPSIWAQFTGALRGRSNKVPDSTPRTPNQAPSFASNPTLASSPTTDGSLRGGEPRIESRELSLLIDLIRECNVVGVRRLVTNSSISLIGEKDREGRPALHHAVRTGGLPMVRFLLDMGANPNGVDDKGYGTLHVAAETTTERGDTCAVVTELVSRGGNVNMMTPAGITPLHLAVANDHLGVVNTLMRFNANSFINLGCEHSAEFFQTHVQRAGVTSKYRKTPVMLAVEKGLDTHVSSLVYQSRHPIHMDKTKIEATCYHGATILHVASLLGHSKVVRVLLAETCASAWTVNAVCAKTVFHYAAVGGNDEVMYELLVAAGCKPSRQTVPHHVPDGTTPPTPSASGGGGPMGGSPSVMGVSGRIPSGTKPPPALKRILTAHGNTYKLSYGEAIIKLKRYLPEINHETEEATILQEVDIKVDELKAEGKKEEYESLQQAMMVVIRRLHSQQSLDSRFFPSARSISDADFHSSSHGACAAGHGSGDYVQLADFVNTMDGEGKTALHYALESGNPAVCFLLASAGADKMIRDSPIATDQSFAAMSSLDYIHVLQKKDPHLARELLQAIELGERGFKATEQANAPAPAHATAQPPPAAPAPEPPAQQ